MHPFGTGRTLDRFTGEDLAGRRIPVLGAGVSGQAASGLLGARGMKPVLFDERGAGEAQSFRPRRGEFPFGVISPGFSPGHPWRQAAAKAGLPLLGEMEIGASAWEGRLVCLTGTNGKTSLTRLLEQALNKAGEKARACGNIGNPISALAAEPNGCEWAVCEVSSFQLHDWLEPFGEAAIWTNFDEDHLDWHSSLEDYFRAKWRLVESGMPVYAGPGVARAAVSFGIGIPDNLISVGESVGDLPGAGVFARPPLSALYRLARAWWIEAGRDPSVLEEAARLFSPLPHRMETISSAGGVRWINDSKATNFHATLAACDSIEPPIAWIGGGLPKGGNPENFARELARRIASADLIGSVAPELGRLLRREGVPVDVHPAMKEAVEAAFSRSAPGGTVLLSPGFASFDQFAGYADRGEVFRKCVIELLKRAESV